MNDSPTYYEAVKSLIGSENCGGGLTDGPLSEIIILNGVTPPTENTIQTKLSELQAEWDSLEYARNRKAEYDALNQLEMQFDDKEDDTTTWEDAIKVIKTKWPKDNSGPV